MRLLILLLLTGMPGLAFAQNLHTNFSPVVELGKAEDWIAQRLLIEQKVRILFKFTEGTNSTYVPPIPSTILVSAKTVVWNQKSYLLTNWQEGVSTTAIRVFDPSSKEKLVLLERYSIGEVQVKITKTGLKLTVADKSGWAGEAQLSTTEWRAP